MNEKRTELTDVDVAVVGAGSAGSAVAAQCARRGMEVLCIDRRSIDDTGARWANNIPGWMFDVAELQRPEPPELMGDETPIHMFAGYGRERIVVEDHGLLEVDMRRLVKRLQTEAMEAGARFVGRVDVEGFDGKQMVTSEGPVLARWFVDASGLGGAGLIELERPGREHICTAAQGVYQLTEPEGARQFFVDHDVPYGDTLCYAGVHGGYSVVHVRAHGDERLHVLTGSIPGRGNASGRAILKEFVDGHGDWIGERLFGGSSPIPLGPPVDRLARGRVAVVGDAACQVLSAHGSGVGAGLIAAKELARALEKGEGVDGYAVRWQRRWGGLFAAYDLFRRFSADLTVEELATMMESGLLNPHLASLSLRQTAPIPRRPVLPDPSVVVRAPSLAASLVSTVAKMALVALWYRRFPEQPNRVDAWSRPVRGLFDETG